MVTVSKTPQNTRPTGQKDEASQFVIRSGYKTEIMYARERKPRLY